MMLEASQTPRAPSGWLKSLECSKAQVAADQTALLPVLDQLRASAERLEAEMGVTPDKVKPNQVR